MNGKDNRGRRRPFRNRNSDRSLRGGFSQGESRPNKSPGENNAASPRRGERPDKKGAFEARPVWTPPVRNLKPIPDLKCIRCGLPIADPNEALADRKNGEPVHFDCVLAELAAAEKPENGDILSYIGGGRFGIVHFNGGRSENSSFTIKKIFEWEDKEQRAEWRDVIASHYPLS